jgi:hypothetical protein
VLHGPALAHNPTGQRQLPRTATTQMALHKGQIGSQAQAAQHVDSEGQIIQPSHG